MTHKTGHFGSADEPGGYLTNSYISEKRYDDLVRRGGRYIVEPGKMYGVFIVPNNIKDTIDKSDEEVLNLSPDLRNYTSEYLLNRQVNAHEDLHIWNAVINPPDRRKSYADILDDVSQSVLDSEINHFAGFGPEVDPRSDLNETRKIYKEKLEEYGLDEIGLSEEVMNGTEELTMEMINRKVNALKNLTFTRYETRTEDDLQNLEDDLVEDFGDDLRVLGVTNTNVRDFIRDNLFFNAEIDPNTGLANMVEVRRPETGGRGVFDSSGFDLMEITTDNLFDSGHIMTHQEYIWAGITVGVGSDRISRFVESALDIASGNYSGTVQEKHAEANRILDYLGIDKQDMFEIFGHSSPIDAVDAIGEDWLQGFNDNINSVIKDVRVHGKPSNLFYDLANKTLTGDVERDPSDIYPILGATFTEDKVLLDAFRSHNWNFSQKGGGLQNNLSDVLRNTDISFNGRTFNYNPSENDQWEEFTDNGRFTTGEVQHQARIARDRIINDILTKTDIGSQYTRELEAGELSIRTAFGVYKEFIDRIGENGSVLMTDLQSSLAVIESTDWKKDLNDWIKRREHAKNYLNTKIEEIVKGGGPLDADIDALATLERMSAYGSYQEMFDDPALEVAVLAAWKQNQLEGPIDPKDYDTEDKRKKLLNRIIERELDGIFDGEWSSWQNVTEEDKQAIYELMYRNRYGSIREALEDPEFIGAATSMMSAGAVRQSQTARTAFQGSIGPSILSKFHETGIINANTTPEFYSFLTDNVIPDMEFQATVSGVNTIASLEALIAETIGTTQAEYDAFVRQMDSSTPPSAPGMPGYAPSRPTGQLEPEPAPEFDLTGMTPALLEIAEERPEYATWLQGQMKGTEFQQAWNAASRPTRTFDREQYEEETGFRHKGDVVGDTPEAEAERAKLPTKEELLERGIRPYGAGVDYKATFPGSFGQAPSPWATDEEEAVETPPVEYTYPEFGLFGEGIPASDQPEAPVEAPVEESEESKKARERRSIIREGARDRATTVTPGMTQEEFFESRLPGFEDQFKLTREFQIAENRRLTERRRLLATGRGGGGRAFSVFRRGRR